MTRGTTKEYDEKERDEVIYCVFICSFVLTNVFMENIKNMSRISSQTGINVFMENIKICPELVARQAYKLLVYIELC